MVSQYSAKSKGMSYREIAAVLHVSVQTVIRDEQRAKKKLLKIFNGWSDQVSEEELLFILMML